MNVYVHQKISLGKEREASCIAWNHENNTIALGYQNGSIKLIRIEENEEEGDIHLSLNENLPAQHTTSVSHLSWNEKHDKLLSLDQRGQMVIWSDSQTGYTQEMINESDRKRIRQSKWSLSGDLVVLAMEGGSLVLGSTDGRRLWGRELAIDISHVCFVDEDRALVAADAAGAMVCVDSALGETFAEIELAESTPPAIKAEMSISTNNNPGGESQASSALAVFEGSRKGAVFSGFRDGGFFVVSDLRASEVRRFDFGLSELLAGAWSASGEFFALSARVESAAQVLILSSRGDLLRAVALSRPSTHIAFSGGGERLLLAGGPSLSYARVSPPAPVTFSARGGVLFVGGKGGIWSSEGSTVSVSGGRVLFLRADAERVLAVWRRAEGGSQAAVFSRKLAQLAGVRLPFEPSHVAFRGGRAALAKNGALLLWDLGNRGVESAPRLARKRLLLIRLAEPGRVIDFSLEEDALREEPESDEEIRCLALGTSSVVLVTAKGVLRRIDVQTFVEMGAYPLRKRPVSVLLTSDESHAATLDVHGELSFLDLKNNAVEVGTPIRDVGSIVFSEDSLDFAVSVKSEILEGAVGGSALRSRERSDSLLLGLDAVHIHLLDRTALVDEPPQLLASGRPSSSAPSSVARRLPTLAFARLEAAVEAMLTANSPDLPALLAALAPAPQAVQRHFARQFLVELRLDLAAALFRLLEDFPALRLAQRLAGGADPPPVKRAAALFFLGRDTEATRLLEDQQRTPALIKLLSDTGRLDALAGLAPLLDLEQQRTLATALVGRALARAGPPPPAAMARQAGPARAAFFADEGDFEELGRLMEESRDPAELRGLATALARRGAVDWAARALEKAGDARAALELALRHSYWSLATEIAERNEFPQVDNLLARFAGSLQAKRRRLDLVELYRRAQKHAEAARVLNSLAEDLASASVSPLIIKKAFVLAALEVNLHARKGAGPAVTAALTAVTAGDYAELTRATLDTLAVPEDRGLASPWRGAEAWHLLQLTLTRLRAGEKLPALAVARRLPAFEAELSPARVYPALALASLRCAQRRTAARCLAKLEAFYSSRDQDIAERFSDIAVDLFGDKEPVDEELGLNKLACPGRACQASVEELDPSCNSCRASFPFCVLSGKTIFSKETIRCFCCKHRILKQELAFAPRKYCPLCHHELADNSEKRKQKDTDI